MVTPVILQTSKPSNCQCVPKHMCIDNNSGANIKDLVDIRVLDVKCENQSEICCLSLRRRPMHKVLLELKDESEEPASAEIYEPPVFDSCGHEIALTERIVGGKMVTIGELPWTTAILFKDQKYWKFSCAGSIIHPQVVLTAGHCVYQYTIEGLRVRAGDIDNDADFEPYPHQDSVIIEKIVHQHFNPRTLKNDIALLFLKSPFQIAPNVKIICLPSGNVSSRIQPFCESGGYGVDAIEKPFTGKQLKKNNIPLVSRTECVYKLRSTRLGGYFNLHRSFICAGGSERYDTCSGDGGGALVCPMKNQPNRFIQVGIVSWGVGCGRGIPGVYANVNYFMKWIDDHMKTRNLDTSLNKYK
ncbi:phenoloxidase-activating factor 2-like [Harmonia axyridis]|uniref:phenoloxidase-activating factor 2-like n=1 Tax=Harmonia axyridis TaxID=115357 RepID=UPI001E275AB2|nr:phenoloxidase-activating factor 2-like [Harmonia axyridis]